MKVNESGVSAGKRTARAQQESQEAQLSGSLMGTFGTLIHVTYILKAASNVTI